MEFVLGDARHIAAAGAPDTVTDEKVPVAAAHVVQVDRAGQFPRSVEHQLFLVPTINWVSPPESWE